MASEKPSLSAQKNKIDKILHFFFCKKVEIFVNIYYNIFENVKVRAIACGR